MLRRYVAVIEWWEGETEVFTSWSLRRLRRRVAVILDGYLREQWAVLPQSFNPAEILPLIPEDSRSVRRFLREVREIPDWGYPSFYRIMREDRPARFIDG